MWPNSAHAPTGHFAPTFDIAKAVPPVGNERMPARDGSPAGTFPRRVRNLSHAKCFDHAPRPMNDPGLGA